MPFFVVEWLTLAVPLKPTSFWAKDEAEAHEKCASATGTQLKNKEVDPQALEESGVTRFYQCDDNGKVVVMLWELPKSPHHPQITFRLAKHDNIPGVELVEICIDGKVCAALYPQEDGKSVKLVSAHFAGDLVEEGFPEGIVMDNGVGTHPPIPSVRVTFDPRPYTMDIEAGRIARISPKTP